MIHRLKQFYKFFFRPNGTSEYIFNLLLGTHNTKPAWNSKISQSHKRTHTRLIISTGHQDVNSSRKQKNISKIISETVRCCFFACVKVSMQCYLWWTLTFSIRIAIALLDVGAICLGRLVLVIDVNILFLRDDTRRPINPLCIHSAGRAL